MEIHPVPVRSDNYAYIVKAGGRALFVDPFDVPKVVGALEGLGLSKADVVACLTTHHHADHAGGNEDFAKQFPGLPIYGGSDKVLARTHPVQHGDELSLLPGVTISAHATPCHTTDSICYLLNSRAILTGDTLFVAGCGRFFEGTAAQMLAAMRLFRSLPTHALVYPGHEYTRSNAEFAAAVMPHSAAVQSLLRDTQTSNVTTGKYTLAQERQHNPFMRTDDPEVQKRLGASDETDTMHKLREAKNSGSLQANM